jgi:hypothetical protein
VTVMDPAAPQLMAREWPEAHRVNDASAAPCSLGSGVSTPSPSMRTIGGAVASLRLWPWRRPRWWQRLLRPGHPP